MVVVEFLLTVLFTAVVGLLIFLLCFNTRTTKLADTEKKKKVNKKKGKNKGNKGGNKKAAGTQGMSIKQMRKMGLLTSTNAAKNKPKINLSEHENLVAVFRGHLNSVTGVAWHQSGKFLWSCGKDKCIFVWENPMIESTMTDEYLSVIKAEDGGEFSGLASVVTPTPLQDEALPSVYEDDEEKKDDANPLQAYDARYNQVFATTAACFGLHSYGLLYAERSNKYELQLTSHIQTEFHKEPVRCIGIAPDLSFLCLSGSQVTKIYFYDVKAKQRQSTIGNIKVGQRPTNKADLRQVLASCDKTLETIDAGQFINFDLSISADGNYFSIGTFKKDLRLWAVNYIKPGKRDIVQEKRFGSTQVLCTILKAHTASIMAVTFSCDSKYMISAGKDGMVKVWNLSECKFDRGEKPELSFECDLGIGEIDFLRVSHQFDIVAVMDPQHQKIFIYQMKYEKQKMKLRQKYENVFCTPKDVEARINTISFSPNSQFIAVGSSDFDVRVYRIPHKKTGHK